MGIIMMDQNDKIIFTHNSKLTTLSSQKSLKSIPSLTSSSSSSLNQHYLNYRLINSFTAHSAPVTSITISGGTVFTGSSDREVASWTAHDTANNNNNNNNFAFLAGNGAVKSLAAAPGGSRLFTAHQDHKIRVWGTVPRHRQLATLPTLGDRAARLVTPGSRVTVRRHKTSTWVHHVDAVSALALSPDGSLLYSTSWDRSLKIWRTKDFKCMESVSDAHDDAINAVVASPDGHVFTGSADKKIKVWMRKKAPSSPPAQDSRNTSASAARATSPGSTGTAYVSASVRHCLVASLEKHQSGINALAMGRGGAVLYSGAGDRSIVVWERVEDCHGNWGMVVLGALRGHERAILCLAASGDLVFSGSADKTVRVWRGVDRNYSCLAVFNGHNGPVKCLTAVIEDHDDDDDDDDESYLVYSGGLDCEVKVWQIIVPSNPL